MSAALDNPWAVPARQTCPDALQVGAGCWQRQVPDRKLPVLSVAERPISPTP